MRTLAGIARRYDRGYGHFTTRQNIQFNWIRLKDERLIDTFVSLREDGERFIDTVVRVGHVPFKERVYGEGASAHNKRREAVSV